MYWILLVVVVFYPLNLTWSMFEKFISDPKSNSIESKRISLIELKQKEARIDSIISHYNSLAQNFKPRVIELLSAYSEIEVVDILPEVEFVDSGIEYRFNEVLVRGEFKTILRVLHDFERKEHIVSINSVEYVREAHLKKKVHARIIFKSHNLVPGFN